MILPHHCALYIYPISLYLVNSWKADGNMVFSDLQLVDNSYETIVKSLSRTGAPAVVLFLTADDAMGVVNAAKQDPLLGGDYVVWIGVDSWVDASSGNELLPSGYIGIGHYVPTSTTYEKYLKLWGTLDSVEYPDADDNRSTIDMFGSYTVDCVFALALAYQKTINDNTEAVNDQFRQLVYQNLVNSVIFDGVSGPIDITSGGNIVGGYFSVKNSKNASGLSEWVSVGAVNASDIAWLHDEEVVWPDGSVGVTSSYSNQLYPYCAEGMFNLLHVLM